MSSIYKYTTLSSAIKIIRGERVILNPPSKFNDPFDCSFSKNIKDREKSFELIFNYNIIQMIKSSLVNSNIKLNKKEKELFHIIKKEMNVLKEIYMKEQYYKEVPLINDFVKLIIKKHPELKVNVNQLYDKFVDDTENLINKMKDDALISCFSEKNDSILMWSHYADSHRGVCLEFERPEIDEFANVLYSNERAKINIFNTYSFILAHNIIDKTIESKNFKYIKDLITPFLTKSLDWEYEKEVRCIFSRNNTNDNVVYDGERYFYNIGLVKRIYIGTKAYGADLDEIISMAKRRNIEVVFMKESDTEFKIIPNLDYAYKKMDTPKINNNPLIKLIEEINLCLSGNAYISAFILATTIPAICGSKLYPGESEDIQYKKWTNEWFSKYEKDVDVDDEIRPYLSAELLYDLRKEFNNHGNFNIIKKYDDFRLDKFILRKENKKPIEIYTSKSSIITDNNENKIYELTINVRDFCKKLISIAEEFYKQYSYLFSDEDNILIEDYDKIVDEFTELNLVNKKEQQKV